MKESQLHMLIGNMFVVGYFATSSGWCVVMAALWLLSSYISGKREDLQKARNECRKTVRSA